MGMTATDELRRMLDERGVEHYDGVECTFWGDTILARRDGSCPVYRFSATEVTDGVSVHLLRVSPEQAIEATLGRDTCEWCANGKFDGQTVMMSNHGWQTINYCPNCGRKVVED